MRKMLRIKVVFTLIPTCTTPSWVSILALVLSLECRHLPQAWCMKTDRLQTYLAKGSLTRRTH